MSRRRAAYVRVSTPSQDDSMQREAIARAVALRGAAVDDWYSDDASRDQYDRRGLNALREQGRRGQLDTVWVWRLDRLGSGALGLLTVCTELQNAGAQVCSVTESFDSRGPLGAALLALIGSLAEGELEAIRARTAEARRRAERAGKHWGRPASCTDDQKLILCDALKKGLTLRMAAKEAGLSYGTAQRVRASLNA